MLAHNLLRRRELAAAEHKCGRGSTIPEDSEAEVQLRTAHASGAR
jgi:hypothetical protein